MELLTSELYEMADRFVRGRIPLTEVEDWLVPWLVELLDLPPSAGADLVDAIVGGLAEMGDGLLTEAELRERLKELVYAKPFVFKEESVAIPIKVNTDSTAISATPGWITASLSPLLVSAPT